ncbi:ABC-2 transporter permease [Paenibacillus hodogayensis]|uniref:ABC-2 transporter permease n=1 Tax=Paenibacillus hodogayensis TaxID=279208 RepID=A0ABV5VQ69_9BACL
MLQLLVKDFRIQKRFIWLGFFFVGVFFFILGAFEGMPLAVPAAIFSHFLIVVASKMDEKNNNGRMLVSFPLRRSDIVAAKYVGIVLFMGLAFALTALWRFAAGLVLPAGELPWFDMRSLAVAVGMLLLFYSIYFPLFFAFGARLVQVLDVIVIFVVGGAVVLGLRIAEWSGADAGKWLRAAAGADPEALAVWGVIGCLALLLVSFVLSVTLYSRKSV